MNTHAAQIIKARLVVGLLTALSLTVLSTNQAAAQGVIRINSCPFVIVAPGQYLVTQDLFCPPGIGILVESNDVRLNLGGHTITGSAGVGIFVRSNTLAPRENFEIRNGTITNFTVGMALQSANEGRIEAITSTGNSGVGLNLSGADDNTFTSSEFSDNGAHGVQSLGSNGNVFRGNKFTGNLQAGYLHSGGNNNLITSTKASASIITGNQSVGVVLGDGANNNTIQSSQILGNIVQGVLIEGDNNTVRSNTVNENGRGVTLDLGATANIIMSNTAKNNVVFDLQDDNPNCDANVWQNNNFNTANQPQCID